MKNRASTHLLLLLLIIGLEIVGYWAVYDSALLRGYEPSLVGAVRDLLLYVPLVVLAVLALARDAFKGSWALYTTAILLFSVGMLVQYRLYSDPEYGSGNKAQARAEKTQVQRLRYINQFYGPDKKQAMGLDATAAQPDATPEVVRRSEVTVGRALFSSFTWIPLFAFFALAVGLLVLRAGQISRLDAAPQLHHRLVHARSRSSAPSSGRARASRSAT